MATIPAAGYISDNARTQAQVQTALEDIVASLRQIPGASQVELTNTIASGSITPAGSGGVIVVDTEAAAATDDLTNIVTTNYPDGACLLLRNSNAARVVTMKSLAGGAGQFNLDRTVDYVLDDTKKWILLQRRSADWYEIFRGPYRLTSFVVSKVAGFTVAREDLGKTFTCAGTFTVALTAAASLGSGFVVVVKNSSTGTITVDPNSSELVNGATTLLVPPGWSYVLICTGTEWQIISSTGIQPTVNPVINGTMEIWQRGTAFAAISSGSYAADRWKREGTSAAVFTVNRSTSAPTVAQANVLFNYSLEVDVTTADAAVAAGDLETIVQKIEGGTWRHFAQRDFCCSFWVYSTKTGVHCVAFRNSGDDRSYVATYVVNATNTWEYKSVAVLASPSAGTWNYETGVGVTLAFTMVCGSTFQTTAGAWQTGNFSGTSGQVNCMDSTSNFFRITGVKFDLGILPTPLDVVDFEREYLRCLRYYQKSFDYATAPAQNLGSNTGELVFPQTVGASTTFNTVTVPLQVPMRSDITVTYYNPNAANAQVRNRNTSTDCSSTSAVNANEKVFTIQSTTPGGSATAQTLAVHWAGHAEL